MVLTIDGTALEDYPHSVSSLLQHNPTLKENSSRLVSEKSQVVGPGSLLYVSVREFATTYPHDNKISILGSDDFTTNIAILVRHSGSGAVGLTQLDRVNEEGITSMLQRVSTLSYGYEGRTEVHLVGAFSDTKGVAAAIIHSCLSTLHRVRNTLELVTCCVGELCTIRRNGAPWPLIYGIGINVKTGEVFPAQFPDKGPDMDLRTARTFAGGESVGMIDLYDVNREELRIGPFSYEPMRAVDIWLQQTDDFLLQSLSSCPEVSPPSFLPQLRSAFKRIKQDPYPAVSVFGANQPRLYRKDELTGHWVRMNKDGEGWVSPPPTTLPPSSTPLHQQHFKQEPVPSWPTIPVQSQIYY